jgi:hypothetical protein
LVSEKVECSESGSFSDLCPDRRDSGAQALENREMAERRGVTPKPGCHQAKLDREIGWRESGGLGRDPVGGESGAISRNRELVERPRCKPRLGKPTGKA